jgi:hypothetical protein
VVQLPGRDRQAVPEHGRLGVSERRHRGMPERGFPPLTFFLVIFVVILGDFLSAGLVVL